MKSLVALALIFLYTIVSLPISQSRVIYPNDENLIEQTCKQTPNYDLCVTSLNSDRHSATTDVRGLALIMVDVAKAKAVPTLNHINELLNNSTGKKKQALSSCVGYYNTIIKADVPVAIDALMRRNYKFAEQYSTDAANEADSCEQSFSGSSPLSDMNKVMHDVAVIACLKHQLHYTLLSCPFLNYHYHQPTIHIFISLNYNLCVSSLHSDPQSSEADIKGLALIMVNVAKAKAVTTLNHINELLYRSTGKEKQALSSSTTKLVAWWAPRKPSL